MKICAPAFLALLCVFSNGIADTFGTGANQFEIEFVKIGDPGNVADTTGTPNPAGSVDYIYSIGKFEVSRDMVEKANAEGGLGITLFDMTSYGGNAPNRPVTGVSWNEAARFTNWLNTGQGFPAAYKFSTQPGDVGYDPNANIELWVERDPGFDAANAFRNSHARYFLPTTHEWYKAAYYDPTANGGAGGYWDFPTGSDAEPTAIASGTDADTAVYLQGPFQGPADITQAGGLSPSGVVGLAGNVWEWLETNAGLSNDIGALVGRSVRGGSWNTGGPGPVSAEVGNALNPMDKSIGVGFRVASIPEPSSHLLGLLGILGLLLRRRRIR